MKTIRLVLFGQVFFLLGICLAVSAQDSASDAPAPGRQVVESVELPASTTFWNYGKDGIKGIDMAAPLDDSKMETVRYWIYLPLDYEKTGEQGTPLFLFLHGAGERGDTPDEIDKVKVHGPPKLLDKAAPQNHWQKHWPCVTVSPQCKSDKTWSALQLMLLLDHIEKEYKIDKTRIYISGISMGGFGTWSCLRQSPERFAAAAPICGGCKAEGASKLLDIPIWNFHGDQDRAVPIERSMEIVDTIRKAGGKRLIFTVYEGGGHDVWTRTYDNQLLYDWLFSHAVK